jgi:branched-chain amino acid transport system substrate-binding protein
MAAACAAVALTTATLAACGNSDSSSGGAGTIVLGDTLPMSGPAAIAGQRGQGELYYFKYLNDNGGIDGHKVELLLKDDAYNPSTTVQLTRQLVEQDHIVATLGSIGTATQVAVQGYLAQKKIPQLFIASDYPGFSSDPQANPYSFNFEEPAPLTGANYAKDLEKTYPEAKVGVLYQGDDVGKNYLSGFESELAKQPGTSHVKIIAKQAYDTTATSVDSQIAALKQSGADVLVSFAVPNWTPKILTSAFSAHWQRKYTYVDPNSLSSAAMNAVAKAAGTSAAVDGVRSATIFKDPGEPTLKGDSGLALFHKVMDKECPKCDQTSVYYVQGMAEAWTFAEMLKGVKGDITSEAILKAAENVDQPDNPFLLPGLTVKTSPTDHAPIDGIHLVEFRNGAFTLVGDILHSGS